MDENKEINLRVLEAEIQNAIALRSSYMNYILAITGGLVGLFLIKWSVLIVSLFFIGLITDVIFLLRAYECSKSIYFKTKEIKKYGY